MSVPWQPILGAHHAARAQKTVEEIAVALEHPRDDWFPTDAGPSGYHRVAQISLDHGYAGIAVFFAELYRAWHRPHDRVLALRYLDQAFAGAAEVTLHYSLLEGFTGIAWAARIVMECLETSDPEICADVDDALIGLSEGSIDQYDFALGACGIGLYALRCKEPIAAPLLRWTEQQLRHAASQGSGRAWLTPATALDDAGKHLHPEGYFNLGMAHGVSGVMALLALAHARASHLLDGTDLALSAAAWLAAYRLPASEPTSYPDIVSTTTTQVVPRLAWCYSEIGIGLSFLMVAAATGDRRCQSLGEEALTLAAQRPVRTPSFGGAGLCHGRLGVAHMFNRIFQQTNDTRFQDAALAWLESGLASRDDQGIAGFATFFPGRDGTNVWRANPGLLNGPAGIGLALLATIAPTPPIWDELLLLTAPFSL